MTAARTIIALEPEIVRADERLAEVGPAWTDLWRRAGASVFQSHGWIAAWWSALADRERIGLHVALGWRGDGLEAVLPLVVARRRGVRLLEWAARDCTDYPDALLAPGADPGLLPGLWAHLHARGGFDATLLDHLLPEARVRALVGAPAGIPGGVRLRPDHRRDVSHRLDGPFPSGAAWLAAQSKNLRRTCQRGAKAIAARGAMRFRLLAPDEVPAALPRIAALKREALVRQGLPAPLYEDDGRPLGALLRVADDLGRLRVFVLECDDLIVAAAVNFVEADTMLAFVTTYDPDFERASPGILLIAEYLQWSFDRGLTGLDHLRGGEPYKARFSTRQVGLDAFSGARTVRGAAALLVDRLRHRLRDRRGTRGGPAAAPADADDPAPAS